MKVSILIPHFRTLKMTTYSIAQYLKYKGRHDVDIIVIDNSYPDESIRGLDVFKDEITILNNTVTNKQQSHGVAFEMAMPFVKTDYFITAESDSFPLNINWLDYYEDLINKGYTWGGSVLKLSGGTFVHPTGAFYKKSLWEEAKRYCENIPYSYFTNMYKGEDFNYHLMVHNRILEEFSEAPEKFIPVAQGYEGLTPTQLLAKRDYSDSLNCPFHNGMGMLNESFYTYGNRNIASDSPHVLLDNTQNFINRIGYEPGQWFCYWLIAMEKKGAIIQTEIKWMKNRGFQQQEYTLTENGLKHLWSVSAYFGNTTPELQDIVTFKTKAVNDLYDSLPEKLKYEPKES